MCSDKKKRSLSGSVHANNLYRRKQTFKQTVVYFEIGIGIATYACIRINMFDKKNKYFLSYSALHLTSCQFVEFLVGVNYNLINYLTLGNFYSFENC